MEIKIIIILAYVGLMLYLGYVGYGRTKNLADFFIGGRKIGAWFSAFSYGTTYFSAVLFIGFAGKLGWGFGTKALYIALGNAIVGSFLAWLLLARPTREITTRLNAMTMPEFFEARYRSPMMKYVCAIIIFVFLVPYSASIYKGLTHLFEAYLGIPYEVSLFFIAAITGIYLIMGGYHAINLTDFVQGTIMLIGALLMVTALVGKGGGLSSILQSIAENYPKHIPPEKMAPWYMLPALVLLTSLGPWGLPQMVQKFYAIKSKDIIPRAMIITTIFAIIITGSSYFTGAMTHVFFDKIPPGGPDALIPQLLKTHLPGFIAIIILLLVLSASMSTLSSLVLVTSSAIAIDLYKGQTNTDESRERIALWLMRILCIIFVVVSVIIALYQVSIIVNLMSVSWGVVAGCFLAPYLYGLFLRRANVYGAWAAIFTTAIISLSYFKYGINLSPVIGSISMLAPLIILPLVSYLTPPLPQEYLKKVYGK